MAKAQLTVDEQLTAFLDEWEIKRTALVKKYELQEERYRNIPHMRVCYESGKRGRIKYQHDLEMIRELRRRASLPVPRNPELIEMSYGNRNAGSRVSLRKLSTYNSKGCATTYTLIIDVGKDRTRAEELRARVEEACREILEPAASLSVSPVPPDCAKCGRPRSEHHVGQGWCLRGDLAEDATVYEPRIAEELAKQLAPAADSPVPEPSEPEPNYFICCFNRVNEGHDPTCIHAGDTPK